MKKVLLICITVITAFSILGCSTITGSESQTASPSPIPTADSNGGNPQENDEVTQSEGKMILMTLYFANEDNSAVVPESREVPVKDGAVIKAAVEALIQGPEGQDLRTAIPDKTVLLGANRKDDVAIVDFSEEFYTDGVAAETVERMSIVNTLTEIPGIEKVKILVKGNEITDGDGNPYGEMSRYSLD